MKKPNQRIGANVVKTDLVELYKSSSNKSVTYALHFDTEDTNQIFARDLGFVIDDNFIVSSIIPDREKELNGLRTLLNNIKNVIKLPKSAHIEGGDVVVTKDHVFIGYYDKSDYKNQITARTNKKAIKIIKDSIKKKQVIPIELIKSSVRPSENALHLDCCFQPVSTDKAVMCKEAFVNKIELNFITSYYGEKNLSLIHI